MSHIFVLHEILPGPYGTKCNSLRGVFETFQAAHLSMVHVVQSALNTVTGTAFLPSRRFQRVVIEPENRLRWEDTWIEYQILPHYSISKLILNTCTPDSSQVVDFFDPETCIKNVIIRNGLTDDETKTCLAQIGRYVCFPSRYNDERLYADDVDLGDLEKIHAWISRKEG